MPKEDCACPRLLWPGRSDALSSPPVIGIEDLRPGDIVLFPPEHENDMAGHLIAILTGESVTHAALVCEKNDKIIEMRWDEEGGQNIAIMNTKERFTTYQITVKRHPDPFAGANVLAIAEQFRKDDEPFGWSNIYMLAIVLLTKKTGLPCIPNALAWILQFLTPRILAYYNNLQHKGALPMHCSQFIAVCYRDAGFPLQFSNPIVPPLQNSGIDYESLPKQESIVDRVLKKVQHQEPEALVGPLEAYNGSSSFTVPTVHDEGLQEAEVTTIEKKLQELHGELKCGVNSDHVPEGFAETVCSFAVQVDKLKKLMSQDSSVGSVASALRGLESSEYVFITPGDLLNRTDNLETVGVIEV